VSCVVTPASQMPKRHTTDTALVVAAHPDDEVLGCGGAIARLTSDGWRVHVAFLADGVTSRADTPARHRKALDARQQAARTACEILGVAGVTFGDLPDNMLDTVPRLTLARHVEELIAPLNPRMVFTHHGADLNVDHRRVHEAVLTACRPQAGHPVRTILSFELPSSTEWQAGSLGRSFEPNWFIDISSVVDRKLAALDAYRMELRPWPHPRSRRAVEHLAGWRGASIGVDAAEAFMLARHIG
jgi:LmbE family N-acetylglucosaminyl deacetylase